MSVFLFDGGSTVDYKNVVYNVDGSIFEVCQPAKETTPIEVEATSNKVGCINAFGYKVEPSPEREKRFQEATAEVKTQHEEMDRMRANDRQPRLTEIQKEWVANLAEIGEIQEGIAKTALSIVEVCKSEQKAVWILGRDPAEPREAQLTMRTVFMQMHDAFQRSARMLKPFVQGIHRDADLVTRCCEDTPMSEDIIDCEDTPISEMLEAPNSAPQFQLAPSASQHVAPKPNSASLTAPTPPADSEEMLTAKRACLSGFFG